MIRRETAKRRSESTRNGGEKKGRDRKWQRIEKNRNDMELQFNELNGTDMAWRRGEETRQGTDKSRLDLIRSCMAHKSEQLK